MGRYKYFLIGLGSLFLVFSIFLDANSIPAGSSIPALKVGDYIITHSFYQFGGKPARGELLVFHPPDARGKKYIKRLVGMPGDRLRIRQVPACRLPALTGVAPNPSVIEKRTYACGSSEEPVVALIEYRPGDRGPWRNYRPVEVSSARAREVLMDADSVGVLPADVLPAEYENGSPALFQETIDDRTYYTVESSIHERAHLSVDLGEEGFVIDPRHYFVLGDNRDDSKDSRYLGPIAGDSILGRGLFVYLSFDFRDDVCKEFIRLRQRYGDTTGFDLPDFPPEDQASDCVEQDGRSFIGGTPFTAWLSHFFQRWGRASARWERIGDSL